MHKLLLAEDDEFSRDMLSRRLVRSGFEVIGAPNGRIALLLARQHQPDVILMDLDMPVMSGFTATRSLKTNPRTAKIPVIVLTAHTSPKDVMLAIEAGCDCYEAKPIVLQRLLERITQMLEKSQPKTPANDVPVTAAPPPKETSEPA